MNGLSPLAMLALIALWVVTSAGCKQNGPPSKPAVSDAATIAQAAPTAHDVVKAPVAKVDASEAGAGKPLKIAADFANLTDPKKRATALFAEIGKVLIHPRCVNCHPAGDRPRQGNNGNPHQPLVVRGSDNHGAPAMRCETCHSDANYLRMPGAPNWHLAPASMAWEGRSLGAICAQLKDTKRNGGLSLTALHEHMVKDPLVGYGWNPPSHLPPVPGTRARFGELVKAWIDAGAHCPQG